MHGYHGRYLLIDLGSGAARDCPAPEGEARAGLGGAGLAARWLYRYSTAGAEPLSGENTLVVASCPLVDTGFTTTAKAAFAARSPQTGLLGESLLSSRFAIHLKRTGWDGIVAQGSCTELSVLEVDQEGVRVTPAPELAGLSAGATEAAVKQRLGTGWHVAAIGAAGESRVRYATISHDGRHAGRTGLGAVMGAKHLKAIAVRGGRRATVSDPARMQALVREFQRRSQGPDTAKYRLLGTGANLLTFDRLGILPARNFTQNTFPAAERLSTERMAAERTRERTGCASCTVGCEHRFVPAEGESAVRAEYESLFALGPMLGLEDPETVLRAAQLCDEFGLDTLSFGGTISWAMECRERGALSAAELDGLDLRYGAGDAVLRAVPVVARRQGAAGELLAEGSRLAARKLGRGSEAWAMHVKGLELPGYEPRALKSLALGLAVGARGACHNRSSAYDADLERRGDSGIDHAAEAVRSEDRAAVLDSLVVCKFLRRCFRDFYAETAEIVNALTGWDVDAEEMRAAGGRIVTIKRLYNQREGASRAEDALPERLLREAVADGPNVGASISSGELNGMLDAYYQARGWSKDGRVPAALAAATLGAEAD